MEGHGPAQLIAYPQRGLGHFCHDHICLLQPGQVPIMDELVASSSLFPVLVQLRGRHMLGEHHPEAPEARHDSHVQFPILASAADTPAEAQGATIRLPALQDSGRRRHPGRRRPLSLLFLNTQHAPASKAFALGVLFVWNAFPPDTYPHG